MRHGSGRWLGTAIAVLVVVALAIYVATASTKDARTADKPPVAEAQAPSSGILPPAAAGGQPAGSAIVGMGDLVGLVVKTAVVVALLGASLWVLRRYAGTAVRSGGRTGAITMADTLPLAQGRAVYVLDVGDRALLVGATPQQLTLLGEVRDAAVLDRLRAPVRRDPAPSLAGLVERLRAALAPARTPHRRRRAPTSPEADFAATLARLEDTAPRLEPQDRLAAFAARVRAPHEPR
jgi:flagellar biogenesis protein FliO